MSRPRVSVSPRRRADRRVRLVACSFQKGGSAVRAEHVDHLASARAQEGIGGRPVLVLYWMDDLRGARSCGGTTAIVVRVSCVAGSGDTPAPLRVGRRGASAGNRYGGHPSGATEASLRERALVVELQERLHSVFASVVGLFVICRGGDHAGRPPPATPRKACWATTRHSRARAHPAAGGTAGVARFFSGVLFTGAASYALVVHRQAAVDRALHLQEPRRRGGVRKEWRSGDRPAGDR